MNNSNWGDLTIGELEKVHKILASMYALDIPLVAYRDPDMATLNWKIGRAAVTEDVKRAISSKKNRE